MIQYITFMSLFESNYLESRTNTLNFLNNFILKEIIPTKKINLLNIYL